MIWVNRVLGHLFGVFLIYWVTIVLGTLLLAMTVSVFGAAGYALHGTGYPRALYLAVTIAPYFIAAAVGILPYRWAAGRSWGQRASWRDLSLLWLIVSVLFWALAYLARDVLSRTEQILSLLGLIAAIGFVWNIWAHRRAELRAERMMVERFT